MRYLLFRFRLWKVETAEALRWAVARHLPRSIAILVFVRVCVASGDDPANIRYETAYKAWERGAGKCVRG